MKDEVLQQIEDEVKEELGITNVGPDMTAHEAGMIGGHIVKKLVERGKSKGGQMEESSGEEMDEEY